MAARRFFHKVVRPVMKIRNSRESVYEQTSSVLASCSQDVLCDVLLSPSLRPLKPPQLGRELAARQPNGRVLIKASQHYSQLLSGREGVAVDLVNQPEQAMHFHVMVLSQRPEISIARQQNALLHALGDGLNINPFQRQRSTLRTGILCPKNGEHLSPRPEDRRAGE